jgi:P27 family predicted phage terminase small subunit
LDFNPPIPLSISAQKTWDRHAKRIHSEGRWQYVDHDLLATYCQTLELYERCKAEVDNHGVLVEGRTKSELVRNPALTPLNQARTDLIRLAKAVPLVNPNPDHSGAALDSWLKEMCADE